MIEKKYAQIENNKIVNTVINIEPEVLAANPGKYIEYDYTDWNFPRTLDLNGFFSTYSYEPNIDFDDLPLAEQERLLNLIKLSKET